MNIDKNKPDIIVGLDPSCTLSGDRKKRFGICVIKVEPFSMHLMVSTFVTAFAICKDMKDQAVEDGDSVEFFSEFPRTKKNWHGGGNIGSINVGMGLAAMKLFPELLEAYGCTVHRVYPVDTKFDQALFKAITGIDTIKGGHDKRDAGMIAWNAYESIYCNHVGMPSK